MDPEGCQAIPRELTGVRGHPRLGLRDASVRLEGPGPAGHSDGDVVARARANGLVGATALGDLGTLFPAPTTASGRQLKHGVGRCLPVAAQAESTGSERLTS